MTSAENDTAKYDTAILLSSLSLVKPPTLEDGFFNKFSCLAQVGFVSSTLFLKSFFGPCKR